MRKKMLEEEEEKEGTENVFRCRQPMDYSGLKQGFSM